MADARIWLKNGGWLAAEAIASSTFRIRMSDTGGFPESPLVRYQLVNADKRPGDESFCVEYGDATVIRAGRATLQIDRIDGQLSLSGPDGRERLRTCCSPWSGSASGFGARFSLRADEALYGLGNVVPERLNRRGLRVSMRAEQNLWASAPIPFLMSSEGWAVMVNTTWQHTFDIGAAADDILSIEGPAGELDLFLFAGEGYAELLDAYTDVAGKPQLLPIWMYGLNFCPRVKSTARDVLEDAIKFRRSGTPCDLIGLSADWMETVNDFSTAKRWHPERFPTSTNDLLRQVSFIGILHKQGFKLSLTLGCDHDLTLHEERQAAGITDGEPDDPEEAWYDHLRKFVDDGIAAFVLSLRSPMFNYPDRIWGNGMTSPELHNLYPVLLGKQMFAGYRDQTGKRPVIHIEKGYLGMQQFVASTAGTFYNAKHAIAAILNYGLSGHVNTSTNMHLITREGIHADFLLAWSRIHSQDHFHHPDFLELPLQELFRRYARLRYRLLPYLYAAAFVAARTGMPITRAMPLMYPDDRNCRELSEQYMLGDSLLVAVYTDQVYLPEGGWFDYWTGERYSGPQRIAYTVPPGAGGPLFVRAGAIVPMWPQMDHVGQLRVETLTLDIYPGPNGEFVLYEDDGATFDYLDGRFTRTTLTCEASLETTTVRISRREGEYAGMVRKRCYELIVHMQGKPAAVRVDGQRRLDQSRRIKADPFRSWRYDRLADTVTLHVEEDASGEAEVLVEIVHPPKRKNTGARSPGAVTAGVSSGTGGEEGGTDEAFVAALDTGETQRAEPALEAWWKAKMKAGSSGAVWPLHVMQACHLIVRHAEGRGWTAADVFGGSADLTAALALLQSPEQGYELLQGLVRRFTRHTAERRPAAKHPVIRELIVLIEREPDKDLSLNTMAERFALHPFHLSRLFKKETGGAYSDYVMTARMTKARKLLEAGVKVYETASCCGFKDAGNFSKAFSKYWGAPPASFKPKRE
ncbi:TIM-barrel domain-containing protein [Paenibacillus ginsengarvi]|uniref:TIM-barrel domain-containing protein n=1 Tax=Paenibacillus ginsengarvi TaxID=400777 RepID=UPI0013153CB5|nr:TIM-barrel domain-containing protein [Paenibacillus ginsengarvi]